MPNSPLPRVFISYRREWYVDAHGREDRRTPDLIIKISKLISDSGKFTPYFDNNILGGKEWATDIMENLKSTDVVVVLIRSEDGDEAERARHDTGWSDWVQREVDLARGERIVVYPIIISDANSATISGSLEKLNLNATQYRHLPAENDTRAWETLFDELSACVDRTFNQQRARLRELQERLANPPVLPEYSITHRFPFIRSGVALPVSLCVGTGDIARVRNSQIDAIINSENNYMQMARFHEPQTVSGRLRLAGARMQGTNQIVDDAVQRELNAYFTEGRTPASEDFPMRYALRPVGIGEVLVTHAGHPRSALAAQEGVRYLFHAAAVRFDDQNGLRIVRPIAIGDLIALMTTCLETARIVNANQGLNDPARFPGWESKEGANFNKPIERVIMPLFGTGHAGASVSEVAPRMMEGIRDYVRDNYTSPGFSLREIHICVLNAADVDDLVKAATERTRL